MRLFFSIFMLIAVLATLPAQARDWRALDRPERILGGGETAYMQPLWSPDGTAIAVTGPGYRGVWLLNLEDHNLKPLSDDVAAGFGLQWSNNGEAIVSRIAKYEGPRRYNALKIMDIKQGKSWLASDYETRMPGLPHWTESDQKVYVFNGKKLEFFDSGVQATPAQKATTAQIMPYLKNGKIAVERDGSQKSSVFDPLNGKRYLNLVMSPDEKRLAFEVVGGNMYVMDVDGSAVTDLGAGNRPRWAPDSQYLVYQITTDDGHEFTSSDIFTIKIDGHEKAQLTRTPDKLEMNPDWSPDGKQIAFDTYKEGAIYLVAVRNESRKRIEDQSN